MERTQRESEHSKSILGKMYDRVTPHPINKQLQEQQLLQDNQPQAYLQQLHQQAGDLAAAWAGRLGASPLLLAAVVLLPRVREVSADFESDLTSLMNHWQVYDVGEWLTGCCAYVTLTVRDRHTADLC